MKNLFHKHNWKIKERSNIIQYDNMGYALRLFLCKCSCGKTKQIWIDSTESESDCICIWTEQEGLSNQPKVIISDGNRYKLL